MGAVVKRIEEAICTPPNLIHCSIMPARERIQARTIVLTYSVKRHLKKIAMRQINIYLEM